MAQTNLGMIVLAVIVIVIAVAAVAFSTYHPSKATYTTAAPATKSVTTVQSIVSTASMTTISTTPTNNSTNVGGPGQIFLSENQSSSLLGAGGDYNWTSTTDPGQIAAFLEDYEPEYSGNWNITEVWGMVYSLNQTNSSIMQIVMYVQSMPGYTPQGLYTEVLNYTNSTVITLNSTSSGMKYSWLYGFCSPYYSKIDSYNCTTIYDPSNSTSFSSLIGWKGAYVTQVLTLGKNVSSTELANMAGSDLP